MSSIFQPRMYLEDLKDLPLAYFKERGYTDIILDLDNTIGAYDQKEIDEIAKRGDWKMDGYIKAFLAGGTICALVQILMDKTKMMPGRIMVTLVVSGTVLGFLGVYEPFADWAGAGATVPLLGFGNTLWKGISKAMAEDGALGIFKGGFTASAAGICGALVFGYLGSLLLRPQMKR